MSKKETLSDRMRFKDPDLATPMHDEIMHWLDKNVLKVVLELEAEKGGWNLDQWGEGSLKIREKIWERPVLNRSAAATFVDLWVKVNYWTSNRLMAGYYAPFSAHAFEVKPRIDSVGVLLRQLNNQKLYIMREVERVGSPTCYEGEQVTRISDFQCFLTDECDHERNCKHGNDKHGNDECPYFGYCNPSLRVPEIIVVSPDVRFRETIVEQGFRFVNPDDFKGT